MPFYKRIVDTIVVLNQELKINDSTILEDDHEKYTYPIDGWYWFATMEDAEANIPKTAAPEPSPAPTPQPIQQVTMRQARLALFEKDLLDKVERSIRGIRGPAGRIAQIEWESASVVDRNSPLIQELMPSLNLTAEQIDQLFALAATK